MTLLADRTAELAACGERPVLQVLRGLDSGLRGLTEAEAAARLGRDGENEIARRPDRLLGQGLATAENNDIALHGLEPEPLLAKAEVVGLDGKPTSQWALGNRLRVCTLTEHKAVLPFVPMPAGGLLKTSVEMPIQPGNALLQLNPVAQDPASTGSDWSWCDR